MRSKLGKAVLLISEEKMYKNRGFGKWESKFTTKI